MISIHRAVPAVLFSLLFIGAALFTAVRYQTLLDEAKHSAHQRLLTSGNLLSANVESGVRYNEIGIVRSAIEQSQSDPLITLSLLLDRDERIFSSTSRALEGKYLAQVADDALRNHLRKINTSFSLQALDDGTNRLIYQLELFPQGQEHQVSNLVSRLILVADMTPTLQRVGYRTLNDALVWFIISLLVTLVIWWLLRRLIIRPSVNLVNVAEQLADPEQASPPPSTYASEEFCQMDKALRSMAQRLTQMQASYRTLYENNPATFLTVDRDGMVVSINRFGLEMTGLRKEEIIGHSANLLYCEEDRDQFSQHLTKAFDHPYKQHHWQLRHQPREGMYRWVRDVARCIEMDDEICVLIVSQDVSDLYKLSNRLSYQAKHDTLTGLINRSEFSRLLDAAIEKAGTQGTRHCVCLLDLDQFKIVNDTCGHEAGDELLKQVAALLHQAVRKDDILARLGGDEFALLLENCPPNQALEVVANIRATIMNNRFSWGDKFFDIGVCAGITTIDSNTRSNQQLLSEADSACYTAKNLGRNRSIVFDDKDSAAQDTLDEMNWFNVINKALDTGEGFILYLQRIHGLDIKNQNLFKGEILLRMKDNHGQIIPPGNFLPAAERYHLAHKVDMWVVRETLATLQHYATYLPAEWVISINLSAQSISDLDTGHEIIASLKKYPQFKHRLCFEVTETVAMANFASASSFMRRLKDEGYTLSLDDFGSGFSSFGYLKNMPVDYVKIDGMFIRNIAEDKIDQAMVASMNGIAHAIGKATVAEFVENQESVDILRALDVDYGQGYFFHKPQALVDVLQELRFKRAQHTQKTPKST